MQEIVPTGYRQNVLAIIYNTGGELLLGQNRGWGQDWTFVKGGIEKGESKETALFREIYEEIGLNKETLDIVYKYKESYRKDFSKEEIQWKIKNKNEYYVGKQDHIFIVSYNGFGRINLRITNELLCCKWVKIDEIGLYIENKQLLSMINIPFLKKKIMNKLFNFKLF